MASLAAFPLTGQAGAAADPRVRLTVTNAAGRTIPHATVWAYVLPRRSPLALSGDDLERLVGRFEKDAELVTATNLIVPKLLVTPMTNAEGKLEWSVDYAYLDGSDAKRPPRVQVGLVIMKRGYKTVRVDLEDTSGAVYDRKVQMVSDGVTAPAPQSWAELDRLRFEISEGAHNEAMTEANRSRLVALRSQFTTLGERAAGSGDRAVAAITYARMQQFPEILVSNSGIVGYSQGDPNSSQAREYLSKAYSLDPDNPYIASRMLFKRGADEFGGRKYDPKTASALQRDEFARFLSELDAFMAKFGNEVWPSYHLLHATWLKRAAKAEDRARVRPMLEELYRWEPKFRIHEQLLQAAS